MNWISFPTNITPDDQQKCLVRFINEDSPDYKLCRWSVRHKTFRHWDGIEFCDIYFEPTHFCIITEPDPSEPVTIEGEEKTSKPTHMRWHKL